MWASESGSQGQSLALPVHPSFLTCKMGTEQTPVQRTAVSSKLNGPCTSLSPARGAQQVLGTIQPCLPLSSCVTLGRTVTPPPAWLQFQLCVSAHPCPSHWPADTSAPTVLKPGPAFVPQAPGLISTPCSPLLTGKTSAAPGWDHPWSPMLPSPPHSLYSHPTLSPAAAWEEKKRVFPIKGAARAKMEGTRIWGYLHVTGKAPFVF